MPTADSVKTKIQGLIDSANAATGQADADMTTAVATLIAGYGGSGGPETVFYTGTYMCEERMIQDITFSTPGGVTHFVFFLYDEPAYNTGTAFIASMVGSRDGKLFMTGTSNTGVSISAGTCRDDIETVDGLYYAMRFEADSVTLLASTSTSVKYIRAPLANKRYVWVAW